MLNRSGNITFANEAAVSLLQLSAPLHSKNQESSSWPMGSAEEPGTTVPLAKVLSHPGPLQFPILLRNGNREAIEVQATACSCGTSDDPAICVYLQPSEPTGIAERETRLRARLLDETQEAVFTWRVGSTIEYWNRAAERLYGYSAEEAHGQVSHDLLRTGTGEGIAHFLDALKESKQWTGELTHRTKNGETVIVESSMVVVEDDSESIVLESNRDITARKAAEAALHREQQLTREIITQAVDSIFVINGNGVILSANPEAERVFGWSEEELVGQNLHATLHHHYSSGDEYPVSECPINEVHLSGEPIRGVELVFFRKDGSTVDVSCSNVPIHLDSERVGTALIIRDISQRKKMEKALVESEERLRVAIACANMGTWDYNPVAKTGRWDAQCKRSFGLAPALPASYGDFARSVHPDDRKRVSECVRQALDPSGDGRFAAEFRTLGPFDHVVRYADARGQAFFGNLGKESRAIRFIGTVSDVTPQKRSEEALRRANDDLRQFAYAAAHDLQEPLRNVVNLLGLYKRTGLPSSPEPR